MSGRCIELCVAVYNVYVDEQLVTICRCALDIGLLYSEPNLAGLSVGCAWSFCASCVNNISILYDIIYNVELGIIKCFHV